MDRTLLIKNGILVTGSETKPADILVKDEKIALIQKDIHEKCDSIIDAKGLYVFPGAIDTHVHLNDEFMGTISVHDYYSGTLAAAFGGVTSLIDFSNQKAGEPLINTIKRKKEEAKGLALIDYGVHPVMTPPIQHIEEDIHAVVTAGSPTIKCYKTYREEGLLVESDDLERILKVIKEKNGMLMLHTEDNDPIEKMIPELIAANKVEPIFHAVSRPIETENDAIEEVIDMCKKIGGRVFIVHMSSGERLDAIRKTYEEGHKLYVETCTHYLVFTEDKLKQADGIKWMCSPPLRNQKNQNLLWQGLHEGTIFMVTSDDAAYSWEAKLMGKNRFDRCPNGIPGIEPRFNIMYSEGVAKNRITLQQFVRTVSENPAKLFGMYPKKGCLAPGSDADLVLFDPKANFMMGQETLHMATDWSAYEAIPITGKIQKVLSRGEVIIDGNQCLAKKGRGNYLFRQLDDRITPRSLLE